MRGVKSANFQVAYALSKFVNPMAFQGTTAPSNAVSASDQDFVLQAADNNDPLRYMGPSLLDRRTRSRSEETLPCPMDSGWGSSATSTARSPAQRLLAVTAVAGRFSRPISPVVALAASLCPGTTNGSFMRDFGLTGLNNAISRYNTTRQSADTCRAATGRRLVCSRTSQLRLWDWSRPY